MFPKIYINKFIFSDEVQFGFSGATASSSHLRILPLLCAIEESPSLKMYGHKLWQSPAIGRAGEQSLVHWIRRARRHWFKQCSVVLHCSTLIQTVMRLFIIDFNILYVSIDFNSVPQYLLWSIGINIGDYPSLPCSLKLTVLSYKRPFEPHGNYLSNDHLIIENIYSS